MNKNNSFKVAALAASIALAMTAAPAMAQSVPAATQLPGMGAITGTTTAATADTDAGTMSVTYTGNLVIDWGAGTGTEGNGNFNSTGVAGFNIGSDATVTFNGTGGVLNIDSSGNPSQIYGALDGTGGSVFVANSNGVIVGSGASVTATGGVGLMGNDLGDPADFDGTVGSIVYNGTGGDVTVEEGASITGGTVLVAGGGDVNVDLGAITGTTTLSAGQSQGAGGFGTANDQAMLAVTGDGTVADFSSAGDASSSGALTVNGGAVAGTFTNSGTLTLADGFDLDNGTLDNQATVNATGATLGGLSNAGIFTATGAVIVNGGLTNDGSFTSAGVTVTDGDVTNNGTFDGGAFSLTGGSLTNAGVMTTGTAVVTDGSLSNNGELTGTGGLTVTGGSIANTGTLDGFTGYTTVSGADAVAGDDFSITNSGDITGATTFDANGGATAVTGTTGSFTNTGTLDAATLTATAATDVDLGGTLTNGGEALSADNPLTDLTLTGGGIVTTSTPVFFTGTAGLTGSQVKMMGDLTSDTAGSLLRVVAGAPTDDYAVRLASGMTASADTVNIRGTNPADAGGTGGITDSSQPNVILQGALVGTTAITFGGGVGNFDHAVSDVFTGPNGSLTAPSVRIAFTGRIKNAPYLNASNFRYNYLPINAPEGADAVSLELEPVTYTTNGTSNGMSAVNILVNGDTNLVSPSFAAPVGTYGTAPAVTGVLELPNTHLVLQSTGTISTAGDFYWPGYVYLGNIATNDDGSAAPGTLGFGSISLGGDFSNVLPGNVSNGGGIHFITQVPLAITDDTGVNIRTNANSWINFGSEALTVGYTQGVLSGGAATFFGGEAGSGNVVNYGEPEDLSTLLHTAAPDSSR